MTSTRPDDCENLSGNNYQMKAINRKKEDKDLYPKNHSSDDGESAYHEKYQEDDFEKLPIKTFVCASNIERMRSLFIIEVTKYFTTISWIIALSLLTLFIIFYTWSITCKTRQGKIFTVQGNITLIWLGCVIFAFAIYKIMKSILIWRKVKVEVFKNKPVWWDTFYRIVFFITCGAISLAIALYIIFAIAIKQPYNLVSLSGIVSLMLICYVFSTAPQMVNWRPVLLGILMQFIFAWLILTTIPGYKVFKFIGDCITEFLAHTEAGCKMVFGAKFLDHEFAFRILPIIIFMSSATSILYYLGVIQMLVTVIGTAMQLFMGTTAGESLNAGANIFLGMTESPLLIRPLLSRMTNSELHAVMTGGFATIAGSVLGAYIGYGAPANHLISASVMSAPAALAISKLMCPETKKSKTTKDDVKKFPKCPYKNIVEATTVGASESIPVVANVTANLIAFVSILHFLNAVLLWIGERACMERKLSFELICSYLFWPVSLFMGVDIRDCRKVAEMIGIKTFLNEFMAYAKLGKLLENKKIFDSFLNATGSNGKWNYTSDNIIINYGNGTEKLLDGGILFEKRSIVITTYALCGFANFGSMGILLSSLCAMIPHRRTDLSRLIVRSMIAGNIACLLTACIAGLFYKADD